MDSNRVYEVALSLVKGVGPAIAKKLISDFGSAEAIFNASKKDLEQVSGVGKCLTSQLKPEVLLPMAEKELLFLEKKGGSLLFYEDADFPFRLKECTDHPIVLYKKGRMDLNVPRVIGIVGTRKMTQYGRACIERILEDLSKLFPDLLVVSGLAHGVDGCVHRTAMELGLPTVGVLGHGLNMIYPAEHKGLSDRMQECGGLLTEFHSKGLVHRKNFVSRNRIIAGMCDVILVIESGARGGAMLTAGFADSYNRDVCAIPGKVTDLYSKGCNLLIKTHRATMVEDANDIVELMNWREEKVEKKNVSLTLLMELTERERLVVNALEMMGEVQLNVLSRKLQMPIGDLSSLLFEMEMKDLLFSSPGGMYGLK